MFIDASALTALLTNEDDARELLARLQRAKRRLTSPLAVWETAVAVSRVLKLNVSEAGEAVHEYLTLMEIELVAVPPQTAQIALDAVMKSHVAAGTSVACAVKALGGFWARLKSSTILASFGRSA